MTSLTQRVASVKIGENTSRNSEIRSKVLPLPIEYHELQGKEKYIAEFASAQNMTEQLCVIKNIMMTKDLDRGKLQFYADIIFQSPLKHPVRNQVTKQLQQFGDSEYVITILASSIDKIINNVKENTKIDELNGIVVSLGGCFENFPYGQKALERNVDKVFRLLYATATKCLDEIMLEGSPSTRNEYYLFLHNTIRLILSCVQAFFKNENIEIMLKFNHISITIINDHDIPMDIKTNCGLLMAHIAQIRNEFLKFVTNLTTEGSGENNDCMKLCHCIGVVNTIEPKALVRQFDDIARIVVVIIKISNNHATENTMLLSGSRCLLQFSKLLLSNFTKEHISMEENKTILQKILRDLLEFDLSYIEHHMDSVRHICKDLLRNIVKVQEVFQWNELIDEICEVCKSSDTSIGLRSILIQNLGSILGSSIILMKIPRLFDDIFTSLRTDLNVKNCYESLMMSHRRENPKISDDWKRIWIDPLFRFATQNPDNIEIVENLINKCIKNDPTTIDLIVSNEMPLSIKLSIFWTIRKNGLGYKNVDKLFVGLSKGLKHAAISNVDETKVMALRLIVETHKSTEYINEIECEFILLYLKYNSNCQSPATRQKTQALILKFLLRLEVCLSKCKKEKRQDLNGMYKDFLLEFIKLLVGNLFPGANFSRRLISLSLLETAITVAVHNESPDVIPSKISSKLFALLSDSYESNQALALSILNKLLHFKHDEQTHLDLSLNEIFDLVTSVRPTDCLTGAYYLDYYCLLANEEEANVAFGFEDKHVEGDVDYWSIVWLIGIIEAGLENAQKSISLAAKTNPLYGALFTIRHKLIELNFQELSSDSKWAKLIETIIEICKQMTKVVAPIVNSSSPEGHLPNDFSQLPEGFNVDDDDVASGKYEKILSNKSHVNDRNYFKVTPQMILLCAWRTIKEVSLTLGEIVLRSPIQSSHDQTNGFFVTIQQIIDIGEHFKELLSETKHRGAFEQAYVGFSKLCTRLWRVEYSALNQLPMKWLHDIVDVISKDERINEKICATRRSAGIPFMVQAIISAELQVGTIKSLNYCMKHLIELCKDAEKSIEARTHALNIMRALFRCTDLNESVGEYIADGVQCAIRGYNASTWSERNSSTLLFAALINRIFGVQRSKDNICKRNKMTGRIFFLRYPSLYDFIFTELHQAIEIVVSNKERAHKLLPLLLILSRLYPSALDGTETIYKLSEFIPLISECSGSPEMKIRILAAQAIVAFTPVDLINERLSIIFEKIQEGLQKDIRNYIGPNHVHGLLLQALYLVRASENLKEDTFRLKLFSITYEMWSVFKTNAVICATITDVLISIILSQKIDIKMESLPYSSVKLSNAYYPILRKSWFIYEMHVLRLKRNTTQIINFVNKILRNSKQNHVFYEEIETCLNVLLLLFENCPVSKDFLDEFECQPNEVSFNESLSREERQEIIEKLDKSEDFHINLQLLTENEFFYPECTKKAFTILSKLNCSLKSNAEHINALILQTRKCSDDVKNSVTLYIAKCLSITKENFELDVVLQFLPEISEPWHSDSLRLTASNILNEVSKCIFTRQCRVSPKHLVEYTNLVLTFLQDDDFDVRDNTSKTIANLLMDDVVEGNIVETYAQTIFLERIGTFIKENLEENAQKTLIEQIVAVLQDSSKSVGESDGFIGETDVEVFDKNEVNVFAEPHKALLDFLEIFAKVFNDNMEIVQFISSSIQPQILFR